MSVAQSRDELGQSNGLDGGNAVRV